MDLITYALCHKSTSSSVPQPSSDDNFDKYKIIQLNPVFNQPALGEDNLSFSDVENVYNIDFEVQLTQEDISLLSPLLDEGPDPVIQLSGVRLWPMGGFTGPSDVAYLIWSSTSINSLDGSPAISYLVLNIGDFSGMFTNRTTEEDSSNSQSSASQQEITFPQSDWNIEDVSNPGYIQNRPFYDNRITFEKNNFSAINDAVIIDSKLYFLIAEDVNVDIGTTAYITFSTTGFSMEDSFILEEQNGVLGFYSQNNQWSGPFCAPINGNLYFCFPGLESPSSAQIADATDQMNSDSVEITVSIGSLQKIDSKFLPELSGDNTTSYITTGKRQNSELGTNATVEGNKLIATGINSHAEGSGAEITENNLFGVNHNNQPSVFSMLEFDGNYNSNTGFTEGTLSNVPNNWAISNLNLLPCIMFDYDNSYSYFFGDIYSFQNYYGVKLASTLLDSNVKIIITSDSTIVFDSEEAISGSFLVLPHCFGAIGNASHSEGVTTMSVGLGSHSEGMMTQAAGRGAHAEGLGSQALGDYSHAENGADTSSTGGNGTRFYRIKPNVALGISSHAEGVATRAEGNASHSQGEGTEATGNCQFVFGKYNILDSTNNSGLGQYIEIVGNGTDNNSRSNARTLDWSGNEILAGKLTVGAGPTQNMDVATKQYVDTLVGDISSILEAVL